MIFEITVRILTDTPMDALLIASKMALKYHVIRVEDVS